MKAVSASQPGRIVEWAIPIGELQEDMHIKELTLYTEDGIIAVIPMELRAGIPWPPLPFEDWSAVSSSYFERVMALLPDED